MTNPYRTIDCMTLRGAPWKVTFGVLRISAIRSTVSPPRRSSDGSMHFRKLLLLQVSRWLRILCCLRTNLKTKSSRKTGSTCSTRSALGSSARMSVMLLPSRNLAVSLTVLRSTPRGLETIDLQSLEVASHAPCSIFSSLYARCNSCNCRAALKGLHV